jgi:hypothetical protein
MSLGCESLQSGFDLETLSRLLELRLEELADRVLEDEDVLDALDVLELSELGLVTVEREGVEDELEVSELGLVALAGDGVERGVGVERCGLTVERLGGDDEGGSTEELLPGELCGRVTVREGGAVDEPSREGRVVAVPLV